MSEGSGAPSPGRILGTLAVTLVAAAAILLIVVLPAEYGIDPTGLGGVIGLGRLRSTASGTVELPLVSDPGTAIARAGPFRSEEVAIELGAQEEIEFKIAMVEGDTVLFAWELDRGAIYSDFHAEPFNDLDDRPIRYEEKDGVSSGYGALHAPFSGLHGWYWRNDGDIPVQVTLRVSGYYTELKEIHRAKL